MNHELKCQTCGETFLPDSFPQGCPTCIINGDAGRLEVVSDFQTVEQDFFGTDGRYPDSMWQYRQLLPLIREHPVTLGEGGTPLIEAVTLERKSDVTVYLKNETTNPTGSYKDRLNSLLLSNAIEFGETHIATASTGNHGASTAAYASRADVTETVVLIPPETEPPHCVQLQAYGANVAVTDYDERKPLVSALVDRGWYPTVSVTDDYTGLPYACEAYKTIAFELVDQLGKAPSAVFVPVGAGDGLYGVWKGFRELYEMGWIELPPRMIGVQPAERPSVVRALDSDLSSVEPAHGPMPITTSTSGPTAGEHALRAIRESGGTAYGIERSDVEAAIRTAGREGIFPEPASALSVAGVEYAVENGDLESDDTVVCLITGTGIKWPERVRGSVGTVPTIEPALEALESTLSIDVDAPQN